MRVLVAPDGFAGTLSAARAAMSITQGWLDTFPEDDIVTLPLSDGGPGFVQAISASLNATVHHVKVRGPGSTSVNAELALLGDKAWIEAAQACGLHLVELDASGFAQRDPRLTTSFGVGQLIAYAIEQGARQITIGLGGTGTNDGGSGMLAALGARSSSAELDKGGLALAEISDIDLEPVHALLRNVRLTVATDVDNPLLGLRGATAIFAPQKGADDAAVMQLEGAMEQFAKVCGRRRDGKDASVALGAGAGGGLGFALIHIDASRVAGIATVMDAVGFADKLIDTDLVITGEGCLDDQSLHGKVVIGVAQRAANAGVPCVALAGEVRLGKRELASVGIDAAYAMETLVGLEKSLTQPQQSLQMLAARIANTWGRKI